MVKQVILVRHGRPVEIRNDPSGLADPHLDELGEWQAGQVSAWLACEPITHIASSPKQRARSTIEPLATSLGLDIETVDDFDEIDRQSATYVPTERLMTDGGEYWDAVMRQDWEAIGWDSPEAFTERVQAAFIDFVARTEADVAVVGAHGGTLGVITAMAMGIEGRIKGAFDYGSITRIKVEGPDAFSLIAMNGTSQFDTTRASVTGPMRDGRVSYRF